MSERKLRNGYTTGTCASAAARAAAVFAITGMILREVTLTLPDGMRDRWKTVACTGEDSEVWFGVRKDAGDDPDVTNGVWVYARAERIDMDGLETLRRDGSGYWLEQYPLLYLTGGRGIGMVTKDGLSCPAGHYAINPVPRRMILSAVDAICRETDFKGTLKITVAIPEGVGLAAKTFNPKLGIVGGISVLGTTGVVRPMSEEALLETIRLDIHMKAVAGERVALMAPGNYGEGFLRERLGVPVGEAVICSNFVAESVRMLAEEGFPDVLYVGHIGKLIKVSAGMRNTHSKYGDGRMEEMARLVPLTQCPLQERILACNTTEEAVQAFREAGIAETVLNQAAEHAKAHMETWSDGRLHVEVMTFSSSCAVTGQTKGAETLLQRWKDAHGDDPADEPLDIDREGER
ncbi:MAG: cobalt-precorrin-5B (C(1))-methyltransferase CbiD [Clostridiales bacterium]|nr:cobalt-precorrin-5B (C(1))-methyltransferase CbiD [Clostridiales bacterium]